MSTSCSQLLHSAIYAQMFWKRLLHTRIEHKPVSDSETEQLRIRVNRLEIAVAEQRERLDSLEGRHASLSASVRGRLGGRPNRTTGLGNFAVPLPINHMER